MEKMNEYTGSFVKVEELKDIWRATDGCLYTVYKDENKNYYMDAYDAAPSVIQLNGTFDNNEEAIKFAQKQLDNE